MEKEKNLNLLEKTEVLLKEGVDKSMEKLAVDLSL